MKDIKILGVDIAKDVFQLCGIDEWGKVIYTRRVKRAQYVSTVASLKVGCVVMEACGGANHWYRTFMGMGIPTQLISPQHVKPYVKSNKNDRNDAQAIAEAASRASMRFVRGKTMEQQDVQALLKIRDRLVKSRTALINEIRGLLQEYGLTMARGAKRFYEELPLILASEAVGLTPRMKRVLNCLYTELLNRDEAIGDYEEELKAVAKANEDCQRVQSIPGVGYLTALSVYASVGDIHQFHRSRQLSAFIGLVPRQHSSGNKEVLLGISKRGNVMLRTLLIHGARALLRHVKNKTDKKSLWLKALIERRGMNRACVALANKNAPIIWALLTRQETYRCGA
ncbi:IS110-like element IS1111A family transposase [Coxiella burnetii]